MNAFLRGYITAALWSSSDEHGETLDAVFTVDDMDAATLAEMEADCADFTAANADDLAATGATDERNGHDFWLTRNGHGAGFWDRGYGAVGDRLTDAAHVYGSVDLYVTDSGTVAA